MTYHYRVIELSELCPEVWQQQFVPKYFEHTLHWLLATDRYLNNDNVCQAHTLWQAGELVAALPLINTKNSSGMIQLANLTSFYSCEAKIFTKDDKEHFKHKLLHHIVNNNVWHQLLLGPLDQLESKVIVQIPVFKRKVAIQHNWFETDINSYEHYLSERPSRLKNTIKRKLKKAQSLGVNIEYAVDLQSFDKLFAHYQEIYQLSWKGDEYSYAFIREMCLEALKANKLCFAMLTIDNKPAAAQIWFIENRCASIFKLAYDPHFQHLSVGSLLSADMSKCAIEKFGVLTIDFGMGNEAYKQEWMSQSRLRSSYLLFNCRTFFGILSWLKRGFLPTLKHLLTSILRKKND